MSDLAPEGAVTFTTSDYQSSGGSGKPGRYITVIDHYRTREKPLVLFLLNRPDPSASARNGIDDGIVWSFYRVFDVVQTNHYPEGLHGRDIPGEVNLVPLRPEAKQHVVKGSVQMGWREPHAGLIDPGRYPAEDGSPKISTFVLFNAVDADTNQQRIYALSWPKWQELCASLETISSMVDGEMVMHQHPLKISITEPGTAGKLKVIPIKGLQPLEEVPDYRPISEVLTEKHAQAVEFFGAVSRGEIIPQSDDIGLEASYPGADDSAVKDLSQRAAKQRLSTRELRFAIEEAGLEVPAGATRADLERLYQSV